MTVAVYALVQGTTKAVYLMAACVPYILAGVRVLRQPCVPTRMARVVIAVGGALAVVECVNIIVEELLPLRPPANAIVPASAMGLIVLAAALSAALVSSHAGTPAGIAAAVWSVGSGMVVSCAVALPLIVLVGSDGGSSGIAREITNAVTHIVVPVLLAAGIGAVTAFYVRVFGSKRALAAVAAWGLAALTLGVLLLVKAASLPRSERPPFVISGMLLSALGITMLPAWVVMRTSSTDGDLPR